FPILYHKAKGGDLRQWRVWTEGPIIFTEYGQAGGKLQVSQKTATPKNVGRSNETSPSRQAVLEANSLWQHKIDRKYSLTPEEAQEPLLLPMLAHKYKKWPGEEVYVQPKLDGVRALGFSDGTLLS